MKIVSLVGSPHGKKGNTARLLGLVLASPNYIFSVSAQLKAFMDRCCGVIHLMEFEGKYGASVVTSGGGDEASIAGYMNRFLMTTGIRPVGAVWATMGTLPHGRFTGDIRKRALALGENLVSAWNSGISDPSTEQTIAAFRERMRRLMLRAKNNGPMNIHTGDRIRDWNRLDA